VDRILIVDDDKDLQQTLSVILASEGYEIFSAENGKQANTRGSKTDFQISFFWI